MGKYEILGHLATGGMGTIFRARDTELGRLVALKLLQESISQKPETAERFRREAQNSARLRHENIITLYDFGESGGYLYLAMELVEGTNLFDYIYRNGPISPDLALRLLAQVAKALRHAHEQGVIHRDIKPSNILITHRMGKAYAKLIDFGLALLAEEDQFRITRDGSTVGTVDYMAPEQALNSRDVDIRTDIYSLGCTFYHLITGQPPFPNGGIAERLQAHADTPPVNIREFQPQMPRWFASIIHKMLAKKPEDRYQTPGELLDALRRKRTEIDFSSSPTKLEGGPRQGSLDPDSPSSATLRAVENAPTLVTAPRLAPGQPGDPAEPPSSRDTPRPGEVARQQFNRAEQVLSNGDSAYGLRLLLAACKEDPKNLVYREKLRPVQRAARPNTLSVRWLGWFRTLPTRLRFNSAYRAGKHARVLELGEELLTVNPYDVHVHLTMAESAEALELTDLAIWLLQDAAPHVNDRRLWQHLAELYEARGEFSQAIVAWESVLQLAPNDAEIQTKIKNLSAHETIARGRYSELGSMRGRRGR